MKASELRIGNLVHYCNEEYEFSILDFVTIYEKNVWEESFSPIPLTEEWLLKFGFINEKLYWSIEIKDVWLSIDKADSTWCIGVPYEANGTNIKIQHVHQLQNLYFALTGEELKQIEDA